MQKRISVFLAVSLIHFATASSRRAYPHRYWAHASFCDRCMGNGVVEMVGNPEYNRAVQEECPDISYLMKVYINGLTNDTVEIGEILENERRKIKQRYVHPDFVPMIIPEMEDPTINPHIRDLIPGGNYLDEYTALVYGKFIVLASHLRVVKALGMVTPDVNVAYNKFGHVLCKLKQFRNALGLNTRLSGMCHYNETISMYSSSQKIVYSIFVLKQGADSLTTILAEIKEVVSRETNGCNITCGPERQKTLVCP